MILRALFACLLLILFVRPALGQEQPPTINDLQDELHVEHFRVVLNGVRVSDNAAIYLANDDNVYVSDNDLLAWNLKLPQKSAFDRDGRAYYGLQTDAKLA
ncbi:MAG: hypothetical protein JO018_02150, partial [Candidatus Eremiobacteraeota bacterium]|nr:hypothetical protein [Candidatus Eremiobacteraeota bacterium]